VTVVKLDSQLSDDILEDVLSEYGRGNPVVVPTDTIYGISAPISNPRTVMAIFERKNRPIDRPVPIAVGSLPMMDDITVIQRWQKDTIRENLPGPVTLVLDARGITSDLISRDGTVAVRVPRHRIFLPITLRVGPLALTSANRHGQSTPLTAREVDSTFDGELLVLEDDIAIRGEPSVIVDLTSGEPVVLRDGNIYNAVFMREEHER